MKRLATIVCGLTLATAALAGCGSDDSSSASSDGGDSSSDSGDYCDTVEDVQSDLKEFGDASSSQTMTLNDFSDAGDRIDDITAVAPDDIKADWEKFGGAVDSMVSAISDAGLDSDEPLQSALLKMQKDDPDAMAALGKAVESATKDMDDTAAIKDEVKQECDIDLGSGGI